MANYKDVMAKRDPEIGSWMGLLKELEEIYPNVRDMLTGVYDDMGTQTVKGASLTFWLDGTRLKFVVRPKDAGLLGWGVCSDVTNLFRSIELALSLDQIDWKEKLNNGADGAPY